MHQLVFDFGHRFDGRSTSAEDGSCDAASESELVGARDLWSKLTKLRTLKLIKASCTLDSVIAAAANGTSLERLRALSVKDSFRGWVNPLDRRKWFPLLQASQTLKWFLIHQHRGYIRTVEPPAPPSPTVVFRSVKSFAFISASSCPPIWVAELRSTFPALEQLSLLTDLTSSGPFASNFLLPRLSLPQLRMLCLAAPCISTRSAPLSLDLFSFGHLARLRLIGCRHVEFYHLILPRSIVSIRLEGEISLSTPLKVMDANLPQLRALKVENRHDYRRPAIGPCTHPPGTCPVSRYAGKVGQAAHWSGAGPHDPQQLRHLVSNARARGVRLNQALVDKLAVHDLHEQELAWVAQL